MTNMIVNRKKLKLLCLVVVTVFIYSCKSSSGSFLRTNSSKTSSYLISSLDERSQVHTELSASNINPLREELETNVKNYSDDVPSRLSLAKIYFVEKRYNEAREQCQKVLVYDSKNLDAKKILANTYFATGNYDMVSIIINGLDEETRKDSTLLNLEAMIALKEDKSYVAMSKFQEALRTDPNNVAVRMNLGMLYIKHRMFKQAGIQFDRVLALMPNNQDAHLHLAIVNSGMEGYDVSKISKTYKSVLSENPDNSIAWFNLAAIQTRDKKYDQAQASLDKYLDTPYVKSHKEQHAFELLAKIQKLQDQDETNVQIAKKTKTNNDSSTNEEKVVNDNNEIIEEISNLEQELEVK